MCEGIAQRLHEVVEVIRLLDEHFGLFAQAAGAWFLVGVSDGREIGDGNRHGVWLRMKVCV